MRLIKMFALVAAVAVMALAGATSASAGTELCTEHSSLECIVSGSSEIHLVLEKGTVGKLLTNILTVLCLGLLVGLFPEGLGTPQAVHTTVMSFTGCGTNSAHDNCTVTVEEMPSNALLKTGLDAGSLTALTGRSRVQCPGIDCKYDLQGLLFSVGAQHVTANETSVTELGGKFFCPDLGRFDWLLEMLTNAYVLA